jgi:hypothetical protein
MARPNKNMGYTIDPKYNALDRKERWDKETQKVIEDRIGNGTGLDPEFSFFSDEEQAILDSLVDMLVPQYDAVNYVRIAAAIDRQLSMGKRGVRYGDDPWDADFYKKGLAILKETGSKISKQDVSAIMNNERGDFIRRFVRKVLSDAVRIYYSHPLSWNAIGFPGPAFPEGYPYLDCAEAEEWEPKFFKKL